jgi:hypothetical protein
MAKTESVMIELGSPLPSFSLKDTLGFEYSSSQLPAHKGLLVMFICNHCPYVKHVQRELAALTRQYLSKGIFTLAINSNDTDAYPEDSIGKMADDARRFEYSFPYLLDSTQEVAKAFQAACTPDFFLFSGDHKLYYRGQMDSSRPGSGVAVTGHDLAKAMDALLAAEPSPKNQKASLGCNIKWRPGNEPGYFLRS